MAGREAEALMLSDLQTSQSGAQFALDLTRYYVEQRVWLMTSRSLLRKRRVLRCDVTKRRGGSLRDRRAHTETHRRRPASFCEHGHKALPR
jgi:hypothetical protein